ncbi:MAG: hypothetical protein QXG26_01795 [Candidatus Aenigmatarchaeota archaeon]
MNITLDFSYLPIFFILFYIIFPVIVFFFGGKFWAILYMIISSTLGAMVAAAMPLAFIDLVLPDIIEPYKDQFMGLAAAVLKYGTTIFAGIVFFLLMLLQHAIIRLVEATGWFGTDSH